MPFFPTSVPTALQLLDARNNKAIILSAAINDTITTIPVVDTSDIPASGYVTSGDGSREAILYTGTTAISLTGCTRGSDGTVASSHGNASTLEMWGNAAYHNIVRDEVIAIAQNLSDRIGLSATQILAPAGTAASSSYSFFLDTDTGLSNPAANALLVSCAGVARARFNAAGSNIDISVLANVDASDQLNIINSGSGYGGFRTENTGSGAALTMLASGLSASGNHFPGVPAADSTLIQSSGAGHFVIQTNAANPISFGTNSTIAMQLTSNQRILGVSGTAADPTWGFIEDPDTGPFSGGANEWAVACGGAERFRINLANSADDIRIMVYDHTAASMQQVSRGASDSGGVGFRLMRIPN